MNYILKYKGFLISIFILLLIPVWLKVVSPEITKIPKNFEFSAEVSSEDNFYNNETEDFNGTEYSITSFIYKTESSNNGISIIKNIFDVRTVEGEKIVKIERLYGIDTKTGQHVTGNGDKDRDGYLFAPKRLKQGEPFTYWHINYDGPANMKFSSVERVQGLKTFKYSTSYDGVPIDQTKNLSHLPGVPENFGVILEPNLDLWIEPTSGYMVKYEDNTLASFYNIQTGEKLNPWNKFGNRLSENSIRWLANKAKRQKYLILASEVVAPAILFVLASAAAVNPIRKIYRQ